MTSVINDVLFTQFMTELAGSVTCIGESCDWYVMLLAQHMYIDWHVILHHVSSHVTDSNNLRHNYKIISL